jgi:ATP-dependent helicase HrpA
VRNAAAIAAIESLEARLRRRDLLVGEAVIVEFYLERIPAHVVDLRTFQRWWRERKRLEPDLLDLPRDRLLARPVPAFAPSDFPDRLDVAGNSLELRYVFDPLAEDDGVTLVLPLTLLPVLQPRRIERLVPGLVRDKVIAILRGLPKELRRSLVPIPDAADRFLVDADEPADSALAIRLAAFVTAASGTPVSPQTIDAVALPPWLRMNIQVVDAGGRVLRSGRDLTELRRALPAPAMTAVGSGDPWQRSGVRRWDFGPIPHELSVASGGVRLGMYPTVEDRGDSVSLGLHLDGASARVRTRAGLARLAALTLPQQHALVRRNAATDRELTLWLAAAGLGSDVFDEIADRAVATAVLGEGALPGNEAAFAARVDEGRSRVAGVGDDTIRVVRAVAQGVAQTRSALERLSEPLYAATRAAIDSELTQLVSPGWVRMTPETWFRQLPKYAQAASRRVSRLRGDLARDQRLAAQVEPWSRALHALESASPEGRGDPRFFELRWAIEEFRLSLHAQDLRTRAPVSPQRLEALLHAARRAAGEN